MLSAWLRIPSGQSVEGEAGLFVWWYSGQECYGIQTHGTPTQYLSTSDSWVRVTAVPEIAPPGTQSATVYLNNYKKSDIPGEFAVWFDGIRLSAAMMFADGFETGDTSAWSTTAP